MRKGIAGFVAATVLAVTAVAGVEAWNGFKVREIVLGSNVDSELREQVRAVVEEGGDSLLSLDLDKVRTRLNGLKNVRSSSVRRVLPDRIAVDMEEHQPLARWEPGGLVNVQGEMYSGTTDRWLPIFRGPGSRLPEMAEYYFYARHLLGSAGNGLQVVQLHLSDLGEWSMFLDNGWILNLGSHDAYARLKRFVETRTEIVRRFGEVSYIDLRYPNGMAVRGSIATIQQEKENVR